MAIDDLPPGTLAWCDHCRTASLPRYFSDGPHSGRLSEPLCQRCGLSFEYLSPGALRRRELAEQVDAAWPGRNANEPAMAFGAGALAPVVSVQARARARRDAHEPTAAAGKRARWSPDSRG